ncbi:hypothetical protein DFR70_12185 [Nocardia tenerifensis]|uniref:Uncharacterized protein n=1 Tax=Nocardia tenerifensis TaxID=228006 RepID=A0A318JQ64_9NOCA|nr:hypothetical protein DFR70_12185 [Nocardia tenerifensis]
MRIAGPAANGTANTTRCAPRASAGAGRVGGGTGGQAVVDDHHGGPGQRRARATTAVYGGAAVQLVVLLADHRRPFGLGNQCARDHVVIEGTHPVLAHRTEDQPRPTRHDQLGHHRDIETDAEHARDLVGQANPAARDTQDHHLGSSRSSLRSTYLVVSDSADP